MAKIFFIGVGRMGLPIAVNLVKAGHEVAVRDVNPSQVEAAVKEGATVAAGLASGVQGAEFIFCSLPTSEILVDTVAGKGGVAEQLKPGQIFVEMSTVSVASSRACAAAIEPTGAEYLRCPVNGSTVFARDAQLTVIASGPKDAYDRTLPLLEKISEKRFYLGVGERARLMKLAVNTIIGTTQAIFTEAVVLCEKGGIDWDTALDVFSGSSIASPQLLFKIPPLRTRDYTPTGTTSIITKDTGMFLEAAKELGVFAPVSAVSLQLYEAVEARGHRDEDFSIILETVEAMSGIPSKDD